MLADPERFIGETLADPWKVFPYGRCKAMILGRPDGSLHPFAHGRTTYDLKLDYRAVAAELQQADDPALETLFVKLALTADLNPAEIETAQPGTSAHEARQRALRRHAEDTASQRLNGSRAGNAKASGRAPRPRPKFAAPATDAEWLPVVDAVTEVLRSSSRPEPPMRDPDGYIVQVW